ncbi:spore germination protein [Paenibacillus oleatilyticus]|uniref:spore germination protein n=1 Tax=Paenibacillus oleatilyticus TaxID=2594886 RepID=UPI001C1F9B91|nr:spore germination protein [Paenibacillus oleatilyticus]MBU7314171.1 spore germination protein [Paenibacillus oleatilyticus]
MPDISKSMAENLDILYRIFSHTPDLITRHFQMKPGAHALLVYLDGLTDKPAVSNHILHPLIHELDSIDDLSNASAVTGQTQTITRWADVEMSLFRGNSVLFVDGLSYSYVFSTQGGPERTIKEPDAEKTLKGAHLGFVEADGQNIALIRRFLPNRELKIKQLIVGTRGKTKVSILYLEDIAKPDLLEEIENRLRQIDTDHVLNAGELEEFIEDHPASLMPQFVITERPDTTVSHLLQGRIAIIVDNSSGVLIGPVTFLTFFQAVEDYSSRWIVASFIRLLRFVAFFITISLPAVYIAIISFHYEVLPLRLLISIGESRAKVPFPPIIEALVMEISIEMLREAGLRLPGPLGQTIGVVGGIIIGQAAVQAGIVSNIMVIIVAITAVSSFIIPDYDMASALRLIRFPMMVLAMFFGMVGIVIGLMIFVIHLISMESVGVPYGGPVAPIRIADWKDIWIRMPLWKMNKRPFSVSPVQMKRQGPSREGKTKKGDDRS